MPKSKNESKSVENQSQEFGNETNKPNINIGDMIYVQAAYMISHQAIISGIFSESGSHGFQVSVVYIEKNGQAMTAKAKLTETGWQFIEGQIHQHVGEGLGDFVQKLRDKNNI